MSAQASRIATRYGSAGNARRAPVPPCFPKTSGRFAAVGAGREEAGERRPRPEPIVRERTEPAGSRRGSRRRRCRARAWWAWSRHVGPVATGSAETQGHETLPRKTPRSHPCEIAVAKRPGDRRAPAIEPIQPARSERSIEDTEHPRNPRAQRAAERSEPGSGPPSGLPDGARVRPVNICGADDSESAVEHRRRPGAQIERAGLRAPRREKCPSRATARCSSARSGSPSTRRSAAGCRWTPTCP